MLGLVRRLRRWAVGELSHQGVQFGYQQVQFYIHHAKPSFYDPHPLSDHRKQHRLIGFRHLAPRLSSTALVSLRRGAAMDRQMSIQHGDAEFV